MAFSSFLKCHPFLFQQISEPVKNNSLPFTINHVKQLTPFSFAVSSSVSSVPLSSDFTPKQLLDTLRGEDNGTSALRVFEWASKQPNFAPTLPIYEEILRKLGEAGYSDSMRQVFDDMKHSEVEVIDGFFFLLIDSYAKFSLYDEAVEVLDLMENEFGMRPGTHSFNFLLNVLVEGNKLILVESVLSRMLNFGVKRDVSTFNILIKALCKAHQIRPAMLMMEEMPNYGLAPDEKTYTTIMQGYIEEGNVEGALRVREQMVAVGCL